MAAEGLLKFLENLLIDEYSYKAVGRLAQIVLALCVILLLLRSRRHKHEICQSRRFSKGLGHFEAKF